MASGINAQIADAVTESLLQSQRVATGLRLEVWRRLAALEADILAVLKMADPSDIPLLRARREAIEALMAEEIDPLIAVRYSALAAMLTTALVRLARHKAGMVQDIVNTATGEATLPELPPDAALRRVVTETLIPTPQRATDLSATGAEWWERQGQSLSQRIRDSLLVGVSLEENLPQLTARIRGTSDNGFEDGIMARARTDASTVVQTQVTNAVGEAHVATAMRNATPQLIIIHTSILDTKTSSICLARHGLRFTATTHDPIGHSIPYLNGVPYHPNCRSSFQPGVRTGGPIPQANVTQWLQGRSTAFQDQVLGPTRAQMFRAGRLTPRQLIEAATGKALTLEELGA
jgi:hypothetical protein